MNPQWLARALGMQDPFQRKLYVVGVLTERLRREGVVPVVVGGTAVEWHTRGLYQSADVDLLCPSEPLARALEEMGFTKEGRHWYRADLRLAIEAPGTSLESYRDRTVTIETAGLEVTMLSVEEAILDRLRACVHWQSALDCEQALQMMVVHREALDWSYLEQRAVRDQVGAKLADVRALAAKVE